MVTRGQFRARMPPLRFFVDRVLSDCTQRADRSPVHANAGSRNVCARRFIHERHELVGEAGHRAADADAAHVGTAADSGHPSSLGNVAVHHRTPASEFHDAFGRAIDFCEIALLVVAGAVATVMHGLPNSQVGRS